MQNQKTKTKKHNKTKQNKTLKKTEITIVYWIQQKNNTQKQ